MPKEFKSCIKGGGRVRTIKPNKKTYMHVCFKGGKSVAGETHHMKESDQLVKAIKNLNEACACSNEVVSKNLDDFGKFGTPEHATEILPGTFEKEADNNIDTPKEDETDAKKISTPLAKAIERMGTKTDDKEMDTKPDEEYPVDWEDSEDQDKEYDKIEESENIISKIAKSLRTT